jgi:hypothetical protein
METTNAVRKRSPNKTWCGVSIDLYRRRKAELSKEAFAAWWFKKTGRSVYLADDKKAVGWKNEAVSQHIRDRLREALSQIKVLEIQLDAMAVQRDSALKSVEHYRTMLANTHQESKSWLSRLFNLKG